MDFRDAPVDQAELVRIRRQLHMYPETQVGFAPHDRPGAGRIGALRHLL